MKRILASRNSLLIIVSSSKVFKGTVSQVSVRKSVSEEVRQ